MSHNERVVVNIDNLLSGLDDKGEVVGTPDGFAQIFADYAHSLLNVGLAQRFGNYIIPYNFGVTVKESARHGRVTYVTRTGYPIPDNFHPVTHEIHFPSVDKTEAGRKNAAEALFVRNQYGEDGTIVARDAFHRTEFLPDDRERALFLEELFDH